MEKTVVHAPILASLAVDRRVDLVLSNRRLQLFHWLEMCQILGFDFLG